MTSHFTLVYDVSHAHRRIPVEESEWGRLGCQIEGTAAESYRTAVEAHKTAGGGAGSPPFSLASVRFTEEQLSEEVWLNTVGTFGVGSAGYWWGRAGALLVRLSHYLPPTFLRQFWLLLYADDGKGTAGGDRLEHPLLFHLFLLEVLGTPIKWRKVHGGIEVEWVGYWLDYRRFEMGISESRAVWVCTWLDTKIRERRVALGELREALGRLVFVTGPLEHLRPMLGPLFAWASAGRRHARPRLPAMLLILMEFMRDQLADSRMIGCREPALDRGELFRLDAKAEGDEVCVGGWLCAGGLSTRQAPWFSVRLNKANAPWAYARGEPFRTIASLELLGALLGVMLLLPLGDFGRQAGTTGLITVGCATDNQGNSYLVDRLMTTKYPLGIILVELCHQLALRHAALRARWVPRDQNEEADSLTNSDFRHFSADKRIAVELEDLPFGVLHGLLAKGEAYVAELAAARANGKQAGGPAEKRQKKIQGLGLRETQPW